MLGHWVKRAESMCSEIHVKCAIYSVAVGWEAPPRPIVQHPSLNTMLWAPLLLIAVTAAAQEYPLQLRSAPPLEQCRPATLRWSGGQGPYTLRVAEWDAAKGSSTFGPLRRVLAQTYAVVYDWDVDYARGTRLYLEVIDDDGAIAASSEPITVGDGPSTCKVYTPPPEYVNSPSPTAMSSARNALASASSARSAPGVLVTMASAVKGSPSEYTSARTGVSAVGWSPSEETYSPRPYDGGPMSMREPQTGDPIPRPATKEDDSGPNVGLIVGTTVAGVVVLAVILGLAAWIHSLRRKNRALRARIALLENQAPVLFKGEGKKSLNARSSSEHSSATCV